MLCPDPRSVTVYSRTRDVGCARRACPHCGVVWLGDTRVRALAAAAELTGAVALVSVTAPGRDVLPWDADGSRVEARAAQEWNRAAPAAWSRLHAVAAVQARKVADVQGADWRLLFKAWEYQRRGVLHLHLVVPCGSPAERRASEAYVAHLASRAPRYGFGFVDRGKLPDRGRRTSSRALVAAPAGRAAAYVAGYVASSGAGKGGVAEVAAAGGVPGAILYVAQALTDRSGVTMRSLRNRRRVVCLHPTARLSSDHWQAARVIDALERRRPPLTAGARGALVARALAGRWTHTVEMGTGEVRGQTLAPAPPGLQGADVRVPRATTVGRVRLDSVLHRDEVTGCLEWISRSTPVEITGRT